MPTTHIEGSKRFVLNTRDWSSIGKGFLIGASGLLLTFLTSKYITQIPIEYHPFITVIYATLVNLARKYLMDYSNQMKGGKTK